MAKSSPKSNAAFAKKKSTDLSPSSANNSKFQLTEDADMATLLLDPADGLSKFFVDSLKDIYWAENQLIKTLPKMIMAASQTKLKKAINNHLEQTKMQVQRIEEIFSILGRNPQARKCEAMEGLTKEGEGVTETTDLGTPARDLAIIMASQKVEHYEIAAYSGLLKLANNLGLPDIGDILTQTLTEEEDTEALLSTIADDMFSAFGNETDEQRTASENTGNE